MNGASAPFGDESTPAKHRQHRRILGQNLGDQAFEPAFARDQLKMPKQRRPNSLSLVFVDDRERDFGRAGFCDDITPGTDDGIFSVFVYRSHERDMRDEVDVDEEIDLSFTKAAFGTKEAAIERLGADTPNRRKHGAPVFRLESPNDSGAPIAQRFDDGIGGCLCHVQIT